MQSRYFRIKDVTQKGTSRDCAGLNSVGHS